MMKKIELYLRQKKYAIIEIIAGCVLIVPGFVVVFLTKGSFQTLGAILAFASMASIILGIRNRKKEDVVELSAASKINAEKNENDIELSADELDIPSFLRRK